MGALTNNGRKMANYVGFYKGIQSAGAAVMWSLDANGMSYMDELISNWVLLAGSLIDTSGPSKILPVAVVDPRNNAQSFPKGLWLSNRVDSKLDFLISFLFLSSVFACSSYFYPPHLHSHLPLPSPSVLSVLRIRDYLP